MSILTARETVMSTLNNHASLTALGLIADGVVQADTLESPTEFPFIVVRWTDEVAGLGRVRRAPVDLWVYDAGGDYSRLLRIGETALAVLADFLQAKTIDGHIMQIDTKGASLGRGRDLYDDGFDAVVVPFRAQVVHTGS